MKAMAVGSVGKAIYFCLCCYAAYVKFVASRLVSRYRMGPYRSLQRSEHKLCPDGRAANKQPFHIVYAMAV